MRFEEKIVELRKQKGLSQEELAEKLGVSRQAVSRWELGQTLPDIPNLLQLCELFGVSADYLVRDEWKNTTKPDEVVDNLETEAEKAGGTGRREATAKEKKVSRRIREREKIRYQARHFYYTAVAAFIMALAFLLAFLIDSKWACFGIGIGQFVGAGILWIWYNRAVKKIEQMNLEIEESKED